MIRWLLDMNGATYWQLTKKMDVRETPKPRERSRIDAFTMQVGDVAAPTLSSFMHYQFR